MQESFRRSTLTFPLLATLVAANGVVTYISPRPQRIAGAQLCLSDTGTDTAHQTALATAQATLVTDTAAAVIADAAYAANPAGAGLLAAKTAADALVVTDRAAVVAAQAAVTATTVSIKVNGTAVNAANSLKIYAGGASNAVGTAITGGSNQYPGGARLNKDDVVTIDITAVPATTVPKLGFVVLDIVEVDV
jgi:hypothetical protein